MKKRALIIIPLCIAVLFSACSINTASDFVETETKSPATELMTTEPTTVVEDGTGNDAGTFPMDMTKYPADTPQQVRDALNQTNIKTNEFFVYSAVGEIDYTNEEMNRQIKRLKKSDDIFKFTDTDKSTGNITFKVILPDYHHEYSSGFCYACNAINAFWQ